MTATSTPELVARYRRIALHHGACPTCIDRAPETYGCPDCQNTGWNGGNPFETIATLTAELDAALALAETSRGKALEEAAKDERMWWFLHVLDGCGGWAYSNDEPGEWVAAFCGDYEPLDTFNRAADEGLTTVSFNDMTETSIVRLTDAGRTILAKHARSLAEASDRAPRDG